ncbi:MAG: DUF2911 domain-containing protein [Balneolaceae bacterium]|nr:DUF2911 domain-containing protein [Balneolaceae bacterium]
MKPLLFSIILLMAACGAKEPANVGFITRLGADTVAVETFELTADGIIADVVVRSPRTVLTTSEVTLGEDGGIQEMTMYRYPSDLGYDGERELYRTITRQGDSLEITTNVGDETSTAMIAYENGVVPFLEYTHWPFEIALRSNEMENGDMFDLPMLGGRRTMGFKLFVNEDGNTVIRHPSRGEMVVERTMDNGISKLDASATTQKLMVERTNNIPIKQIAMQFKRAEANGKVFGALSGAVTQEFDVNGTNFRLEYGSPLARGRELFGGIVSYGERWRTGANRATHFRTSSNIRLGYVDVPAGEYTFFTIPEVDGGTLIINKQTGQNGRTYNEELDLGRTAMMRENNAEYVESFTIIVSEDGDDAALNLLWGNTRYTIPIEL